MAFDLTQALQSVFGGSGYGPQTAGMPNSPYAGPVAPPPQQPPSLGPLDAQGMPQFGGPPQISPPPPSGGDPLASVVAPPAAAGGPAPSLGPLDMQGMPQVGPMGAPPSTGPDATGAPPPAAGGPGAPVSTPPSGGQFGPPEPFGPQAPPQGPQAAPTLPPPINVAGGMPPQRPMTPPPGTPQGVPPPMRASSTPDPNQILATHRAGQQAAGPWLGNIFGDPRQTNQMTASLGAGLKAVGQNWNKPGLAAFAGTAGAAIEGGNKGDTDFFNRTRAAKEEQLKYQAQNDKEGVDKARIQYWQDRLAAAQKAGTVAGRQGAWQNTEYGRYRMAEQEAQNAVKAKMVLRKKEYDEATPAEREKMLKEFDSYKNDAVKEAYKKYGLDPNKAEKMKTMGTTKDNPHTALGSWDEFHEFVKPGQWYVNPADGKVLQRKSAPPPPADAPGGIMATTPQDLDGVPSSIVGGGSRQREPAPDLENESA